MKRKQPRPESEVRIYLTASELAARTGLSIRYFQQLAKRVSFASQPEPGGRILFDEAGFKAWIEKGRQTPVRVSRPYRRPPPTRPVTLADGERPLAEKLRELRAELTEKMKKKKKMRL